MSIMSDVQAWKRCHYGSTLVIGEGKTELLTQRVQQEKGCDTLTQFITNSSNLSRKPFIMDLEQAGMTIII